jgi:hypothetical protein
MSKIQNMCMTPLRYLARITFAALLISAPVLAMANTNGGSGSVIDHIQKKNNGVGFVLLVSLQR